MEDQVGRTGWRWLLGVMLSLELLGTLILVLAWVWEGSFRESSVLGLWSAWGLFIVRTSLYQIGIGLLIGLVVLVLLRRWRLGLGLVAGLAICFGAMMLSGASPGGVVVGETLRVMSFNLRADNGDEDLILGEIRRHEPDLLVLQESIPYRHAQIMAAIGDEYPYVQRVAWDGWIGMSVFSKREMAGAGETLGGQGRSAARFRVVVDGRALTVFAIHPPHPWRAEDVRIGREFFADLRDEIREVGGGVMVVGDCNWGSTSPQASALGREGFADAFDLGGTGRGVTYGYRGLRRFLPGYRIDHVYLGGGLGCERAWNGSPAGSDHRPIIAEIGWVVGAVG